ncbi:hypothetical protein [Phormidium sp. FACHB-1136]|uniref:hypothetical protein n=1 Tax=Phormidium sp. FACHB-1136 TaxID=2692848 RepID=UPI001687C7AD|nr:hypothetical protein [Phormidium sp. FACHB-1136]MBD2426356.1 hypothetical protein [Phormidium sp. FACHB-1136]
MTTSSDRLDRIEALVERNSEAIQQLTEETKELKIRFAAYQQASQWVVNLAFGLLATATITTIVTAVVK